MSVVHFSYVHDRGTVRWYGGECFVLLVGVLQQSMLQLSFFRVFYFLSIGNLSICTSPLSATPHCCYILGTHHYYSWLYIFFITYTWNHTPLVQLLLS